MFTEGIPVEGLQSVSGEGAEGQRWGWGVTATEGCEGGQVMQWA